MLDGDVGKYIPGTLIWCRGAFYLFTKMADSGSDSGLKRTVPVRAKSDGVRMVSKAVQTDIPPQQRSIHYNKLARSGRQSSDGKEVSPRGSWGLPALSAGRIPELGPRSTSGKYGSRWNWVPLDRSLTGSSYLEDDAEGSHWALGEDSEDGPSPDNSFTDLRFWKTGAR